MYRTCLVSSDTEKVRQIKKNGGAAMLTIRHAQMDVLEDDARRRFLARVLERVGADLPLQAGAAADAGDWRQTVLAAAERAMAYGMDDEASLVDFARMCLTHGLGFEDGPQHEPACGILQDPDIPGHAKMLLLRGLS